MSARKQAGDGAMTDRTLSIWLAVATATALVAMVIVSAITGATQERFEHVMAPEAYARALLQHASGLRLLVALDVGFLLLYTGFFVALAGHLRSLGRPFVNLALGALLATSVLDIIEDHHIIAMLEAAEHGVVPSATSILLQAAESATKFSLSYLSLVLFGLAIPRTTKLGLALALFLIVGTLFSAVLGYAVPPDMQPSVESGRPIGFLIGFALVIAWLRRPE